MSAKLTAADAQRLAARVLDCLVAVTPGVLAGTSTHGARIGIPKDALRRLAAELEQQYPGAIAERQQSVSRLRAEALAASWRV